MILFATVLQALLILGKLAGSPLSWWLALLPLEMALPAFAAHLWAVYQVCKAAALIDGEERR